MPIEIVTWLEGSLANRVCDIVTWLERDLANTDIVKDFQSEVLLDRPPALELLYLHALLPVVLLVALVWSVLARQTRPQYS